MKRVLFAVCSQVRDTHYPACLADLTFDDLVNKVSNRFRMSDILRELFSEPKVTSILILLYVNKEETFIRRRMVGVKSACTDEQLKQLLIDQMDSLGIDGKFHTREEFKKIIPMNRADREFLKAMVDRDHLWE